MRKALLASLLASGLLIVGVPALAARPPVDGARPMPACADLIAGGGVYIDPATVTPPVRGEPPDPDTPVPGFWPELMVAAPACPGMTYTIYVLDEDGSALPGISSQSVRGDRQTVIPFERIVPKDEDPAICVYATSSAGAHVFDRMPAEGCTRSDRTKGRDYWWFP